MADAVVTERERVGGALHRVRLKIDVPVAETHTEHAQYVELRYHGGWRPSEDSTIPAATKGIFVLASAPGSPSWDVVVKEGGAMADKLIAVPLGTKIITSQAQGKGFPYRAARGLPLVLAAAGSGIAAVLSCAGARVEEEDSAPTYLLYGVREKKDVAFAPELDALKRAGLEISYCLSREHIEEPGFFKGYVQHAAADHAWKLSRGKIFAAGSTAMIDGMRQAAASLGLTAADVFVNF